MNAVRYWNKVSLDLVAADYTPDDPKGPPSVPSKPNRAGPTGTSYALAMIHLGISEVVARLGASPFKSYLSTIVPPITIPLPVGGAAANAVNAAVNAVAATLCRAMYPAQAGAADAAQAKFASTMLGGASAQAIINGEDYGRKVALALLKARQGDGADNKNRMFLRWHRANTGSIHITPGKAIMAPIGEASLPLPPIRSVAIQ